MAFLTQGTQGRCRCRCTTACIISCDDDWRCHGPPPFSLPPTGSLDPWWRSGALGIHRLHHTSHWLTNYTGRLLGLFFSLCGVYVCVVSSVSKSSLSSLLRPPSQPLYVLYRWLSCPSSMDSSIIKRSPSRHGKSSEIDCCWFVCECGDPHPSFTTH